MVLEPGYVGFSLTCSLAVLPTLSESGLPLSALKWNW